MEIGGVLGSGISTLVGNGGTPGPRLILHIRAWTRGGPRRWRRNTRLPWTPIEGERVGRFFRQREQASKEMVKAGRCTEEATLPATTAGARITAAKSRSRPRAKELAQAMERPSTVELVHHTQEEGGLRFQPACFSPGRTLRTRRTRSGISSRMTLRSPYRACRHGLKRRSRIPHWNLPRQCRVW